MLSDPTFWVLVAFLIFLGIAGWLKVHDIVITGLDGHSARIKAELDEAQRLREEAQATLATYQRKQREALQEAEQIMAHAREEAEIAGKESCAALEVALQRREAQAVDKIAQAEAAALQEVRDLTVDVALAATRKVLGDSLQDDKADALVDAAIKELPDKLH